MPNFIIQLILAIFFLTAGQLQLTFGLLGEMMMKTYFNTQGSLPYHIKEKTVTGSAEETAGRSCSEWNTR